MQCYKQVLREAGSPGFSKKTMHVRVYACVCACVHLNAQSLPKIILVITLMPAVGLLSKAKCDFFLP